MTRWTSILMAGSIWVAGGNSRANEVGLIRINGAIGPATASYISRSIDVAAANHSACLIIQLDTPGGLLDSTKDIVQRFYASVAADVAVMAPNTSIGAAHPVSMGMTGNSEKPDDVMKKKMENYAATFIESIADRRHRNVKWAKSAVMESEAITAEKSLELNVIDLIADGLPDLLQKLDGRTVGNQTLQTAKAALVEIHRTARERFFQALWRPEVMFILMLVAIYGIIGEMSNPGAILPGIAGAGWCAQLRPVQSGTETMLGKAVAAISRIDAGGGRVFIEGEHWNAVSDTSVEAGQTVEVIGIEGLTLKVKPKDQ